MLTPPEGRKNSGEIGRITNQFVEEAAKHNISEENAKEMLNDLFESHPAVTTTPNVVFQAYENAIDPRTQTLVVDAFTQQLDKAELQLQQKLGHFVESPLFDLTYADQSPGSRADGLKRANTQALQTLEIKSELQYIPGAKEALAHQQEAKENLPTVGKAKVDQHKLPTLSDLPDAGIEPPAVRREGGQIDYEALAKKFQEEQKTEAEKESKKKDSPPSSLNRIQKPNPLLPKGVEPVEGKVTEKVTSKEGGKGLDMGGPG